MMRATELAAYCFTPEHSLDEQATAVLAELRAQSLAWMNASARYQAFIEGQRDKIRRKARRAGDEETLRDLWTELAVAERLLRDRRITLDYERYASEKMRGPDFTATYTSKFAFNVEVRRLRSLLTPARWLDVLCDKLGQMPPSSINVLFVAATRLNAGRTASSESPHEPFDLAAAMARIKLAAERREERLFQRRGLAGGRAYLQALLRLSAVVLWQGRGDAAGGQGLLWENGQAKFPLPREARAVLLS